MRDKNLFDYNYSNTKLFKRKENKLKLTVILKNSEYLWKLLLFFSLDIEDTTKDLSVGEKCCLSLIQLLLTIVCVSCAVYPVSLLSTFLYDDTGFIKNVTATSIITLCSICLWIAMFKRRTKIRQIILRIFLLKTTINPSYKSKSRNINIGLVVICCLVPSLAITLVLLYNTVGGEIAVNWMFGLSFESEYVSSIMLFLCVYFYYFQILFLPCIINFLLGILYYNSTELLCMYKKQLQKYEEKQLTTTKLICAYSDVRKVLEDLNELLSIPSFIASLLYFTHMCLSLSLFLTNGFSNLEAMFFCDIGFTFTVCASSSIYLPGMASGVPVHTSEIKVILERIYEKSLLDSNVDDKTLEIVDSFKKKDCFFMSAYNAFQFDKSYIFSVFGALFSYGLLFLNIKGW